MSNAAPALVQSELVLGRYRPLRPLGSGGSGSVWLARDERNGLDVALKMVPREGKAASRAEREAEAAARLRHPSCQRAYGFGRDSRHVYIAYEYVPGRTFREALRSGELDDASAIEATAQVLEALAHAHERGIVHRDVKPSNVLLAEGRQVSVRVLDFGLAQIQEAETLAAVLQRVEPRRRQRGGRDLPVTAAAGRLLPPLFAALYTGWTSFALPFYPGGWAFGLAALAAGATAVNPRVGLAFSLAVPVLPLGNLALGAAILYGVVATSLFALAWREPRSGLLFALGPVLA